MPDELKPAKTKETHTKRISPKSIGQNLGRAFQGASGDMMKSEKAASDSGASVSGSTEMFSSEF
ncbi:unnamed protein product [Anisakis simplex]|uniref:Uncharacterized protein n=1 Tax=Anisakis simplex TaxID=6269 RepID=A0A3P6P2S2_ANISI|nr:unnamed protein product [Anisakis simplex]